MASKANRRKFLRVAGVGAAAVAVPSTVTLAAGEADAPAARVKIIGISGSPRKGKTTAAALAIALEAAHAVDPQRIETELVELAGLKMNGEMAAGIPLEPGGRDDFPDVAARLTGADVGGILIGSPVYFGSLTSLCKAFLDRCIALRKADFALANKVGGALAVGAARNGGQELTLQAIHAAMLAQEMILVGDGRPTCHTGATLWNNGQDDVSGDEFGLATARNLGRRVAEVALKMAGTK